MNLVASGYMPATGWRRIWTKLTELAHSLPQRARAAAVLLASTGDGFVLSKSARAVHRGEPAELELKYVGDHSQAARTSLWRVIWRSGRLAGPPLLTRRRAELGEDSG